MDYDKLIEHLRECGTYGFKQEECRDAAIAIETLRADLARVTAERDGAIKDLNEFLSMDELREMDGQPVYVVPENEYSELGGWCVISADDSDDYSCALVPGTDCWCWRFEAYGEQWLAYRRPPEGEEDT